MTASPPPATMSLAGRCRELMTGLAGRMILVVVSLVVVLLWCYWPTLERIEERWSRDPQYSHGFLVPIFAGVVLWSRRQRLAELAVRPSWWGLPILALGLLMHIVGGVEDIGPLDAFSLLPTLAGLVLLVGGHDVLRWSGPAIGFLAFMLPLPFGVEMMLTYPLRRLAAQGSTYLLQTLGYPALAEGNIIVIEEVRIGVVDACNGLGMLVTFFALATALALVIQAPLVDRLVLVVSAIPIALVANIARITATAVAQQEFGSDAAHVIMHDLAGWLMMPLALALLWLEMRFLAHLFVPAPPEEPLPLLARRRGLR